ncbi:MAG: ABC transporter ATP-binding protein/permease [Candidatus Absconditabacterales bacterium]|nr:ABC transporter ATP-binding protein/permease [Candidatus Absconditabacterales bacterium]
MTCGCILAVLVADDWVDYRLSTPKCTTTSYYLSIQLYQENNLPGCDDTVFCPGSKCLGKMGTGRTVAIVQTGIDKRFDAIHQLITHMPGLVVTFVYFFWVMSSKGWQYVTGAVIIFFIVGSIMYRLQRQGTKERRSQKHVESEMTRTFVRGVMHKFGIMMADGVRHELEQADRLMDERMMRTRKRHKYIHGTYVVAESFVTGMRIALLGIGGMMVFAGTMDFGEIGALLVLLGFMNQGIWELDKTAQMFWKERGQIEALWDFLDKTPVVQNLHEGKTLVYRGGDIVFDKVSFGYNEEKNIFSDFDCTIQGGKKTALVGPSGGGKSTLIKLIAGYIRPDSGKIIVEGHDRAKCNLSSYYKHIGYLTQEPSVFDGTVRENLLYGLERGKMGIVEDGKINEILDKSQCQFIYDLPHGLDTEIGERGVRLSGGQKQRLAIAKIMLKNPKIILLDEPTSALDSVSEELVSQAMQELFKNRTVIIIAHRLQTVKHADRILYIDNGQIVEQGTHDELIALGGKYAKMVEVQTGF